jgi:hypothetical protein
MIFTERWYRVPEVRVIISKEGTAKMAFQGAAPDVPFSKREGIQVISGTRYEKRRAGIPMDFVEKAKIRLEHWITHNDHHQEEYEMFVEELESAGKKESAEHVREMVSLNSQSTTCLRKALEALES